MFNKSQDHLPFLTFTFSQQEWDQCRHPSSPGPWRRLPQTLSLQIRESASCSITERGSGWHSSGDSLCAGRGPGICGTRGEGAESKSCVSESLRCFGNCGRTPADAHLSVPLFPCQLMGLVSMSPIRQLGGQGRETRKAEFIVKINNNYCKDNLYDQCCPPREDGGLSLLTSAGQLAPNPSIRTRK